MFVPKPLLTIVKHERSSMLHALRGRLFVSQSAVSSIIVTIKKAFYWEEKIISLTLVCGEVRTDKSL